MDDAKDEQFRSLASHWSIAVWRISPARLPEQKVNKDESDLCVVLHLSHACTGNLIFWTTYACSSICLPSHFRFRANESPTRFLPLPFHLSRLFNRKRGSTEGGRGGRLKTRSWQIVCSVLRFILLLLLLLTSGSRREITLFLYINCSDVW